VAGVLHGEAERAKRRERDVRERRQRERMGKGSRRKKGGGLAAPILM